MSNLVQSDLFLFSKVENVMWNDLEGNLYSHKPSVTYQNKALTDKREKNMFLKLEEGLV